MLHDTLSYSIIFYNIILYDILILYSSVRVNLKIYHFKFKCELCKKPIEDEDHVSTCGKCAYAMVHGDCGT